MSTKEFKHVHLWQLISSALPVGTFHYSQALEQAISCGWISDSEATQDWIEGVLVSSVAKVDLPLIARIYEAWRDRDVSKVYYWNQVSRACRETAELREEEEQMGQALCRLAIDLDETLPKKSLGYTAAFAVLSENNNIALDDALLGYGWSWCENQVLAAVKLIPLGHREGQKILRIVSEELSGIVSSALNCEEIGGTAPGFVLASARHETQYSRLFRS